MKIRIYLSVALAVAAITFGLFSGFDSMGFQMGVALSVAHAAVAFLPKFSLNIPNLIGCDDDPGAVIVELTKELRDTTASLKKQQTDLKDAHKQVMDTIEKGVQLDKETRENIDKAISTANETGAQQRELAQKIDALTKSVAAGPAHPLTLRQEIQKQLDGELKDKFVAFKSGDSKSLKIVLKEITSADIATGILREPYLDTLVSMQRRPLRIRDLLTIVPVQSDSVRYGQQTLRDNQARIVAEGTPKPYSNYKWEDRTASIEVIAHLAKLTLQAIADGPRLVAEVDSEMRFGLAFAEENEILNGDGTTGHLSGLIDNATAYSPPAGVDMANVLTPIDVLRVAILQIHLQYASPDGQVLNPIDLANIDLLRRDPDKGGGYLFGNPDVNTGTVRLWRLPVVESASMGVGEFLTGAFKFAVHLYDRQGVQVLISTENDDDFETNKATMRCESRIGLGVRRPFALVHGSLGGGS